MRMQKMATWGAAFALTLGMATAAWAGGDGGAVGGEEFQDIWDLLQGWTQGILGRIIALGALIVGIAFGLVRQNIIAAVVGIAMAIVLQYGPDVIEGIMTATSNAPVEAVAALDNGMTAGIPQTIAAAKRE